jgi:uncharacterized protein YcbX
MRGIALEHAQLDERGFRLDRRWMLVDDDGVFISQREAHKLALVDVALADDGLVINAPGLETLHVTPVGEGQPMRSRIWRDVVDALPVSAEADAWFSTFLCMSSRLVFMPGTTHRIVDRAYVPEERVVGFADGFPLLIIGQGSLDLLNDKLVAQGLSALPMRRFRPNIVIADSRPHEEDEWTQIRIGAVDVDVVKPCARCVITTVDPETAAAGREPLRTLATYRKRGSHVLFGQNAVHRQLGSISVGDAVVPAEVRAR